MRGRLDALEDRDLRHGQAQRGVVTAFEDQAQPVGQDRREGDALPMATREQPVTPEIDPVAGCYSTATLIRTRRARHDSVYSPSKP